MAERTIRTNRVELCTESFGDPRDPPVLLIMGIGASMIWWEDAFCTRLADHGRFVIRYDHRDTGRSTTGPPGQPAYTGEDLTADAAGVLDGYDIAAAHLVGVSAGGGMAQELAFLHPERVLSLVLVSTSPVGTVGRELPKPTAAFSRFVHDGDGSALGWARVLAGDARPFDEDTYRTLIQRERDRARDPAASQNHDLVAGQGSGADLSAIRAPTLVIHGTADPMFPLGHGEALAEAIPGATLLILDGAGHGVYREDWDTILAAIVAHTLR